MSGKIQHRNDSIMPVVFWNWDVLCKDSRQYCMQSWINKVMLCGLPSQCKTGCIPKPWQQSCRFKIFNSHKNMDFALLFSSLTIFEIKNLKKDTYQSVFLMNLNYWRLWSALNQSDWTMQTVGLIKCPGHSCITDNSQIGKVLLSTTAWNSLQQHIIISINIIWRFQLCRCFCSLYLFGFQIGLWANQEKRNVECNGTMASCLYFTSMPIFPKLC